jgi:hypothetical protein
LRHHKMRDFFSSSGWLNVIGDRSGQSQHLELKVILL